MHGADLQALVMIIQATRIQHRYRKHKRQTHEVPRLPGSPVSTPRRSILTILRCRLLLTGGQSYSPMLCFPCFRVFVFSCFGRRQAARVFVFSCFGCRQAACVFVFSCFRVLASGVPLCPCFRVSVFWATRPMRHSQLPALSKAHVVRWPYLNGMHRFAHRSYLVSSSRPSLSAFLCCLEPLASLTAGLHLGIPAGTRRCFCRRRFLLRSRHGNSSCMLTLRLPDLCCL